MKASHAAVFYAIFLVVVLVVTGGFILRKTAPKFISPYVTAQVARDLMESSPDVVVIDVSPLFYEDGHLPGAINYPKCAISNVIMGLLPRIRLTHGERSQAARCWIQVCLRIAGQLWRMGGCRLSGRELGCVTLQSRLRA
jgi:hypothetical protein